MPEPVQSPHPPVLIGGLADLREARFDLALDRFVFVEWRRFDWRRFLGSGTP